jgi:Uma2 family endonuclease
MLDPKLLVPEKVRPLSRREYDQLVDLGVFGEERIELLRGMLVTMSPQGGPHAGITAWFARRLIRALDDTFDVRSHSPFAATEDSEPEPDVSVSPTGSFAEHPSAALLLIEVSQSSLRIDRVVKMSIYAEAGVPEYWVVDVDACEVEVFTQPSPDGYRSRERFGRGHTLQPARLPGIAIAVADIPWPS